MSQNKHEIEIIQTRIYTIRDMKVMLDHDLADLYGIKTEVLNQSVKRNLDRFPEEYMFELTSEELESLRSQNVISKGGRGGRRYLPKVFTEHGTLMLASVLRSPIAVKVNKSIIKAFIELRQQISSQSEYEALYKIVKQIEFRMDTLEANHLVDNTLLSGKISQLSKAVHCLSDVLDQFQNTHVVVRKPEDGLNFG